MCAIYVLVSVPVRALARRRIPFRWLHTRDAKERTTYHVWAWLRRSVVALGSPEVRNCKKLSPLRLKGTRSPGKARAAGKGHQEGALIMERHTAIRDTRY